jgi:hypothetical protein
LCCNIKAPPPKLFIIFGFSLFKGVRKDRAALQSEPAVAALKEAVVPAVNAVAT